MQGSGAAAKALIELRPVADLLGDRHRIVINNRQMAWDMKLVARLLRRVAEVLEAVAPSPEALRADLAGPRTAPSHVLSAAELIDTAADLSAVAGLLVHDSEPRWRRFRDRMAEVSASG